MPSTWCGSEFSVRKRFQSLDGFTTPASDLDQRERDRIELGEILESARQAVLSPRQNRIIELWMRGSSVPEIGAELNLPLTRVSDEKYKALRKLEQHLASCRDELEFGLPSSGSADEPLEPTRAGPGCRDRHYRQPSRAATTELLCPSTLTRRNTARTIPLASSTKVVRSTPMDLRPYRFFSFHTPYCSQIRCSSPPAA